MANDIMTTMNDDVAPPVDPRTAMDDALKLVEALFAVATESEDADIVRIAMSGLTNTDIGRSYLRANPIQY